MNDSPLMIKSKQLALEVIRVCKELRISKCESALQSPTRVAFDPFQQIFSLPSEKNHFSYCKMKTFRI